MKLSKLTPIEASLRSDFTLAQTLGSDFSTSQKWSDAIIARYSEPQRPYHTLEHTHSMLRCLDRYGHLVAHDRVRKLAIYFHDWYYDPRGKDNEMESIQWFLVFAREIKLVEKLVSRVSGYIERTITHTLPLDNDTKIDCDLRLFLDFDLEVLSRNSVDYGLYAARIRGEYGYFSEAGYCAGRSKVLLGFLDRDRLYFSDVFYEEFEKRARENLQEKIRSLKRLAGSFGKSGNID